MNSSDSSCPTAAALSRTSLMTPKRNWPRSRPPSVMPAWSAWSWAGMPFAITASAGTRTTLISTSRRLDGRGESSGWPRSALPSRPQHVRGARHGVPDDFARFEIGRLPDGREEWLEFWRHNHLLAEFSETWSRQEQGHVRGENWDSSPSMT